MPDTAVSDVALLAADANKTSDKLRLEAGRIPKYPG